jgi:hypothetical protein
MFTRYLLLLPPVTANGRHAVISDNSESWSHKRALVSTRMMFMQRSIKIRQFVQRAQAGTNTFPYK